MISVVCNLLLGDSQLTLFCNFRIGLFVVHCKLISLESILDSVTFILELSGIDEIVATVSQVGLTALKIFLVAILALLDLCVQQFIMQTVGHGTQVVVEEGCIEGLAGACTAEQSVVDAQREVIAQLIGLTQFLLVDQPALQGFRNQFASLDTLFKDLVFRQGCSILLERLIHCVKHLLSRHHLVIGFLLGCFLCSGGSLCCCFIHLCIGYAHTQYQDE